MLPGTFSSRRPNSIATTWRFAGPEKEVELFSLDTATEGGLCFRTASEERWVARPIGVDACDTTSQSLVSVYAILHQKQQVNGDVAATNAGNEQAGVAYRIPGRATLRVFARKVDTTEYDYFSTDFDIAQFGTVKFLPALFGSIFGAAKLMKHFSVTAFCNFSNCP